MQVDGIFFKEVLDNLHKGVFICDRDCRISYWNSCAEKTVGHNAREITGSYCWDGKLECVDNHGDQLCFTSLCPVARAVKSLEMTEARVFVKHKDGYRVPAMTRTYPLRDKKGYVIGAAQIFSDISSKLSSFKKLEKLKEMAFIDSLTGVGNRRYCEIKLGAKLEQNRRCDCNAQFGVLFIDIDKFKEINDTHGHNTGDKLLQMVAKTMLNNIRDEDFVGRWGGEEFVAVISNVDCGKLRHIAEKLRKLIEASSVKAGDKEIHITVSIGATVASSEDNSDEIVHKADMLMYRSKSSGRNCVSVDEAANLNT